MIQHLLPNVSEPCRITASIPMDLLQNQTFFRAKWLFEFENAIIAQVNFCL